MNKQALYYGFTKVPLSKLNSFLDTSKSNINLYPNYNCAMVCDWTDEFALESLHCILLDLTKILKQKKNLSMLPFSS